MVCRMVDVCETTRAQGGKRPCSSARQGGTLGRQRQTKIAFRVVDEGGAPVDQATVRLIVEGMAVGAHSKKTDANGKTMWVIPHGMVRWHHRYNYTYVYSAYKGRIGAAQYVANGHGTAVINADTKQTVVLRPKGHTQARRLTEKDRLEEAITRWKNRANSPVNGRTEAELFYDLAWTLEWTDRALSGLDLIIENQKADLTATIQRIRWERQGLNKLAALRGKPGNWDGWGLRTESRLQKAVGQLNKSNTGKIATAVTIVNGLYNMIDAALKEDAEGVVLALGSTGLDLLAGMHPVSAGALLSVKILYGIYEALTRPRPNMVEGVIRQNKLPMFNNLGSCPVLAGGTQYRIVKKAGEWVAQPYGWTSPIMPGFAFNSRGALVLVLGDGQLIHVPMDNMSPAEFERIYNLLNAPQVRPLLANPRRP